MCIIAVAGKGTDKYSDMLLQGLKIASTTNTDGGGFAFKRATTKKVFLSKGYTDVDVLIESLKKHRLKEADELVIHLRIGNKGAKTKEMNHPFVLSNDKEVILTNNRYVNQPIVCHNGTFHSYSKHNSDFSDTFFFIQEFMYKPQLLSLLKEDFAFFKTTFSTLLGTNKLCFLFPNEDTNLIKVGDFKEDEGYYFSNDSYKDKTIRNVGGVNSRVIQNTYWDRYHENWEDYEDDYADVASGYANLNKIAAENRQSILEVNDYKKTNPDTEIIITKGTAIDCEATGVKYRLYMDMWIPEKYNKSNQFAAIRWNVNAFNYNELNFKAVLTDNDAGVKIGTFYKLINFDEGKSPTTRLHALVKLYETEKFSNDPIFIPEYRIASLFEVSPKPAFIGKYNGFYRLAQKYAPSKTLLKKIDKLMDLSGYKPKNGLLSYKAVQSILPSAMSMFQLVLTKEVNPTTYMTEISKKNLVLA